MYINDRFVRFYPRIFSPVALYVVTYLQPLVYSLDLIARGEAFKKLIISPRSFTLVACSVAKSPQPAVVGRFQAS